MKKSYYQIDTPSGCLREFTKHAYQLLKDTKIPITLVHYISNHNIAVDFPHRNAKDCDSTYVRTLPSALKRIEARCDTEKPSAIYRTEVTKPTSVSYMCVSQPRNIKQIKNMRHKVLQNKRITHDGLYNLVEIAEDMPYFVHCVQIHPDLVCVVGDKDVLNEFDQVLLLDSPSLQLMS